MTQDEWKPMAPSLPDEEEQQNYKPFIGVVLLGSVSLVAILALLVMLPRPLFTYAASPVRYNVQNIHAMQSVKDMNEAQLEKAKRKYGMDFQKILTPRVKETTRAMKVVANACLPTGKFKTWAIVNVSHKIFNQSTDYLACVMETKKERLCKPAERQRFVEQLLTYRTLRERLIGYENAYARMMNEPMAKKAVAWIRATGEGDPNYQEPRQANLEIGKDLYDKIAKPLTALNHDGYIDGSDFGWGGLVLPSEFASYLKDGVSGTGKCG